LSRPSWEQYALIIADAASRRSEDIYRKVGACILRADGSVAAVGYNGAPPGININWADRDERRKRVIHAESNALRYIAPHEGVLLAATTMPCLECLKLTVAHGIKRIVYSTPLTNVAVYDVPEISAIAEEFGVEMDSLDISEWLP
jgi:dCMP deaminase